MWKVYCDIGWRMIASLYNVLDCGLTLMGIAIWASRYNATFTQWLAEHAGIDQKWLWVPLVLAVLHLLFKAIHERNKQWADDLVDRVTLKASENSGIETARFEARRHDLELLRTRLNEQADETIYLYDPYRPEAAKRWAERVKVTLNGNVKPDVAMSWPSLSEMQEPGQLSYRLAYLRSLIVRLRLEDLKR